jgi:hypothetical protein
LPIAPIDQNLTKHCVARVPILPCSAHRERAHRRVR